MRPEDLHTLFPDMCARVLTAAYDHPGVRAAIRDLDEVLWRIARCEEETRARADWETTRDELLAEIRRLVKRTTLPSRKADLEPQDDRG
ncbi:hypothetical protein ACFORG_17180 [Lutimaribacter marinistellae]|uniref:Uncharacterized protein n=1 Tax=Lutimaribacter marinistellae TaxID=1820329 RepID=A0ABV7TIN6_9RHOB